MVKMSWGLLTLEDSEYLPHGNSVAAELAESPDDSRLICVLIGGWIFLNWALPTTPKWFNFSPSP